MGILIALKETTKKLLGITDETKPAEIAFQTDKPEDLMNELQKEFETAANGRAGYEHSWFLNIAFMMGKHYVQWYDAGRRYIQENVPKWRVRLTINKILPRYRKNLALLDSYDPRTVCTPNSLEVEDTEAATLGTKILQGQKESLHLKTVLHEKNQWQLLCGNGFITLPYWDSSLGTEIDITDAEGKPTDEKVHIGDIGVEAVSPYELFPLGRCTTIQNCPAMAWVKVTTLSEIRKLHPLLGDAVQPESDTSAVGLYMDKINALIATGSSANQGNRDKDSASFVRVWIRPTDKFPKGRYIVYANSQVLEYGDTPNIELGPEYEIPFLKYDDITIPARFWAQSTIEQMIPVNKEINKTHSQLIEIRNLMAKPKWIAVKGTIAKTAITTEAGEVIEWDSTVPGAQPPRVERPGAFDSGTFQINNMLERAIADVGATHEASMGDVPAGVKSGVGLRELKAADMQEKSSYFLQENENKKIFSSALLKLVQSKYKEPRLLKIMGETGTPEVKSFIGADLKNNTDVWIESSDIMPSDRAERQEFILKLFETGILGNVQDDETRKRTLRMMQFGMLDETWDESSQDARYARNENKEMSKGMQQQVQFFDNHDAHILEVMKAIKNPAFREQPPQIQGLFIDHLKRHQDALTPPPPPAGIVPGVNPAVQVPAGQVA